MNFTKGDIQQIKDQGLTIENVYRQIETFSQGIPFVEILTAASVGNGIENIIYENQQKLVNYYESKKDNLDIVKFVPASGAATRMFKILHQYLETFNPEKEKLNSYLNIGNKEMISIFISSIKDFAFISPLRRKIRELYPDYKRGKKGLRIYRLIETLLEEKGLNFNNLPKGLIPFHKYKKYATTAFEEQLYEAAFYASVKDDVYLHFTFSQKHVPFFKEKSKAIMNRVTKKTKTVFHISYSFQKKETDTIAVNKNNFPFRDEQGMLIFRPSGHGALLNNLNEVDADIIFIKNIDNVVAEEYVEGIAFYKKVLAGKLLWLQEKIFLYLKKISNEKCSQESLREIKSFLWNELNIKDIPNEIQNIERILNRPLRVCGAVKNTGATGGGPFWVKNKNGTTSLQIVEISQINTQESHQESIVNEATHFNPVDIVCGIRNYKGGKFDLSKYTDPKSGIITKKSLGGKSLKALELPGLWNGAMAEWNTVIIEVPLYTFNPVKTINDLLKKEHRPNA